QRSQRGRASGGGDIAGADPTASHRPRLGQYAGELSDILVVRSVRVIDDGTHSVESRASCAKTGHGGTEGVGARLSIAALHCSPHLLFGGCVLHKTTPSGSTTSKRS